jgi:hypothetical protein
MNSLRVFVERVPGRIFGPKRDDVTGGRRKQRIEKLHSFTLTYSVALQP